MKENKDAFAMLREKFGEAVAEMNEYAKAKDGENNLVAYGKAEAYRKMMEDIGHPTECKVEKDDDGMIWIPYFTIEGHEKNYGVVFI